MTTPLIDDHNFANSVLDTIDALIIAFSRMGHIIYVNPALEHFLGYSRDEIAQKRIWELLSEAQSIETAREMFANIQAGLQPFQYANYWLAKSGERKLIAWSSSMLDDKNNGDQHIISVGIDITDRGQIEKLLVRERLLLQGLLDSIPDLIFYKDRDGIYQGWNKAFENFIASNAKGEKKEQFTDDDLYSPEQARQFTETDRQVLASGAPVVYETWTTDPSGQPALLEAHKTPHCGPGGEVVGVIGICRDITKHRITEQALRTANLEIEQLIASLSSILIAISLDLRVTRWNPMGTRILGVSTDDAIGYPLKDLNILWEWPEIEAGISQCEEQLAPVYLEPQYFKRTDSSDGYLGVSISPIFNNESALTGYIILGADITEKSILQNRLAQAQKLESIGQLAAGVAHEINTPIQYIGNNVIFLQQGCKDLIALVHAYAELLAIAERWAIAPKLLQTIKRLHRDTDLSYLVSEIPKAIQQSLDGINRVTEIVHALKGFSHPGVKTKTFLNLNRALEDTITVTRNEWKYVADVITNFDPDLPDVLCLPGEINQVFLNILINAADAIADVVGKNGEKGKITVRTRQDGNWVEVRISDTGTGISQDVQDRIFERSLPPKRSARVAGKVWQLPMILSKSNMAAH
jgi:PAS domain S-box-containing protein